MNEIRPLIGGMASSTVNGKNVAINQFNTMQRQWGLSDFAKMTEEEVCSVELFQVFARFITESATTGKDNNKLLMKDTCTQYVSAFKNVAFTKYPNNVIWTTEKLWYTKLRSVIASAVSRRQILLGLAIQEKSDAVDRTLLTSITKGLMKVKTFIVLLSYL